MTRKKVKLAYITNDSARKATFKKRKKGLLKKVSELSTLCGIDACAIIYSPYDNQPEVWPSPLGAQRVLAEFKNKPEMEQSKKMVNQESFLRQRIAKANEQLKKQRKDNREKEVTQVMFQGLTGRSLHNLNMMDLNDLGWLIEQNLKEINKRIETLNNGSHVSNSQILSSSSSASASASAAAGSSNAVPQQLAAAMATADAHQKPIISASATSAAAAAAAAAAFEMNNIEGMQRQQWFMDLMNPQEHLGFGGDEIMNLAFGVGDSAANNIINSNNNCHNISALWSNSFFP